LCNHPHSVTFVFFSLKLYIWQKSSDDLCFWV
jgi:hypothetical protein